MQLDDKVLKKLIKKIKTTINVLKKYNTSPPFLIQFLLKLDNNNTAVDVDFIITHDNNRNFVDYSVIDQFNIFNNDMFIDIDIEKNKITGNCAFFDVLNETLPYLPFVMYTGDYSLNDLTTFNLNNNDYKLVVSKPYFFFHINLYYYLNNISNIEYFLNDFNDIEIKINLFDEIDINLKNTILIDVDQQNKLFDLFSIQIFKMNNKNISFNSKISSNLNNMLLEINRTKDLFIESDDIYSTFEEYNDMNILQFKTDSNQNFLFHIHNIIKAKILNISFYINNDLKNKEIIKITTDVKYTKNLNILICYSYINTKI